MWIVIDDDGARLRDGMWKEIGGKYAEKRSHIPQTTDNLHRVHFEKSFVKVPGHSMPTQLSYSRYNRQVIESGNAFLYFNSIFMLSLSGCDVCPSDAPRSGVRQMSSIKYSAT